MPGSHFEMPVWSQAALLLVQLLTNASGKAADNGPSTWVPPIYVGDPDEVADSWLQPGLDLTVVVIWEVYQWTKRSLALCL